MLAASVEGVEGFETLEIIDQKLYLMQNNRMGKIISLEDLANPTEIKSFKTPFIKPYGYKILENDLIASVTNDLKIHSMDEGLGEPISQLEVGYNNIYDHAGAVAYKELSI